MVAFDYRQAEEFRDCFAQFGIRYLFIGKSGALLLGYPDTTQDTDLIVEKEPQNCQSLIRAIQQLGFELTEKQIEEISRGKALVQIKNGPFDLDLVFAPDGIEHFSEPWDRRVEVEGFPVCHLDDIIASKEASGRAKDKESLPRLKSFREYWKNQRH